MQGLACLTSLLSDFSVQQLSITPDTIDKVGRHLWTKPVSQSPGPHAPLGSPEPGNARTADTQFWEDNIIAFPTSWPEKAHLAVSIQDPDRWPLKYRLLNNDVVVLSFWRFAGLAAELRDKAQVAWKTAKRESDGGQTPEPSLATCEDHLRMCKQLIDAALALQRNVPISFIYCPNEAFRFNEALSLREDIEFLREMTGLSGRGLKWPRSADRVSM